MRGGAGAEREGCERGKDRRGEEKELDRLSEEERGFGRHGRYAIPSPLSGLSKTRRYV